MQGLFFMKDYIEERAVEIAYYIIEHKATVRQTAKEFGLVRVRYIKTAPTAWSRSTQPWRRASVKFLM